MTTLKEIEDNLTKMYETVWVPKYAELLIRAVRQSAKERKRYKAALYDAMNMRKKNVEPGNEFFSDIVLDHSQGVALIIPDGKPTDPDVEALLEDQDNA